MLRFSRLRLSGFKSFVDGTDLEIQKGLTGVVGPNGCGKSNLVEALRWVMGETSAKQMRGSEMDDVIFGGTANRPARNIAEVQLKLDNGERAAPAQFNDVDELEVSRRIERGGGSTYRVNGKEVRARDVQLLFADSATGARSTALVSQGRIGAVIAAKPIERRHLLEEAAGITGLHSRRHEAELRLRGAETNLSRVDDVMVTLEAQLQHLKKQSRQASRYRNLSDHIRTAEATMFLLRWKAAEESLESNRESLRQAENAVAELTRHAGRAATVQSECAAGLPEARQTEAEAAAEWQRLKLAREQLDAEEQRVTQQRHDCETRLEQVAQDMGREQTLAADAAAAIDLLEAERAATMAACSGEEIEQAEAATRLSAATDAVETMDAELARLTQQVAEIEARRVSLERTRTDLSVRVGRIEARLREIGEQRQAAEAEAIAEAQVADVEAELTQALAALESARATQRRSWQRSNEPMVRWHARHVVDRAAACGKRAHSYRPQRQRLARLVRRRDLRWAVPCGRCRSTGGPGAAAPWSNR